MKTNLILMGLLALLLTLTYFIQEKKSFIVESEEKVISKILENKIYSFKTDQFDAQKKEGNWFLSKTGQRLSFNIFNLLEKRLNDLYLIKELEGFDAENLKFSLNIFVNGIKFQFGEMNIDNESFYLGINDKYYLARIVGESSSISFNEQNLQRDKLIDLKALISKKNDEIFEDQLFRYYDIKSFEKISIHPEDRSPYVLDFEENATFPPPINGIKVHAHLKEKFLSLLTQVRIKRMISFNEELKKNRISTVNIRSKKFTKPIIWEIWTKNNNSAEIFLLDPDKKMAFSMIGGSLKLFFLGEQEYWDKKVIPSEHFKNFNELSFKVSQKKNIEKLIVFNEEPLRFSSADKIPNQQELQKIFQLIFNLGNFDQANRVSQLSNSEKLVLEELGLMKITVFDQEILCIKKENEIILVNLNQSFKAHFYLNSENMKCDLKDMVE